MIGSSVKGVSLELLTGGPQLWVRIRVGQASTMVSGTVEATSLVAIAARMQAAESARRARQEAQTGQRALSVTKRGVAQRQRRAKSYVGSMPTWTPRVVSRLSGD